MYMVVEKLDAYWFEESDNYEHLYENFNWEIPDEFNRADYVCDRWAEDRGRIALFAEDEEGNQRKMTYWELQKAANKLANYLRDIGVQRGDRIGVQLPQMPETLIAHTAAWKLGAIGVPLSELFGSDALSYRLGDSDSKVCISHVRCLETIDEVEGDLESLETILAVGETERTNGRPEFWETIEPYPRSFQNVGTRPDDPATLIYTSGTTGQPKGALHAHEVLPGHLPSIGTTWLNLDIENTVFWTPGDWAWVVVYLPFSMLYYGQTAVGYDGRFDPEKAYELIDQYGITNYFLPPTGMRAMMTVEDATERYNVNSIECLIAGSEAVTDSIINWAKDEFQGAAVNTAYGQTEADQVIGECEALGVSRIGSIGKAIPGHEIEILDQDTREPVEQGEVGEMAVHYEGDPVCLTEYWNNPEKTAKKIRDGWLLTEDLGRQDEDGYFWFEGRTDDVIISAGYRIGPEEIEDSIAKHEAVADAGVIGIPDEERGEVPKAFVQLRPGTKPSEDLKVDLQQFVKNNLAKYEYPRELEFIDELPKTVSGKLRRHELRVTEGIAEQ